MTADYTRHDGVYAARALREAAEALTVEGDEVILVAAWLRNRADAIDGGADQ